MEIQPIDHSLLLKIFTDPSVIKKMVELNGCLTHEAAFGVQYHLLQDKYHVTSVADGEVESVELDWEEELPKGWPSLPLVHYHTHVKDSLLMPTGWNGDVAGANEMRVYDWKRNGLDFRALHGITRHQSAHAPWEMLLYQESSPNLLPREEMKSRTRRLFEGSFYEEAEQADVVDAMRATGVYHCELLTLYRRRDGTRFFPEEELRKLQAFTFDARVVDEGRFKKNYLANTHNTP